MRVIAARALAAGLVMAATGLANDAFAADLPVAGSASVNWTGFYIGGDVGGLFAHTTHATPDPTIAIDGTGSISQRPSFGLIAGLNYQVGPRLVFGAEAQRTSFSGLNFREYGPDYDFLQKVKSLTSLTGRFGVLVSADTLAYGKLGAASIETSGFEGFGSSFNKTIPGFQAGAGIETQVTPNISVRGEALYTRATGELKLNEGFDSYRPGLIQYKLGAVYRFDAPQGWGDPAADVARQWGLGQVGEPAWTGMTLGGFGSLNGHQTSWNEVSGNLGPYTDLSAGGGGFVGANLKILPMAVVGVEVSANFSHGNFIDPAGTGLANEFHRFASVDRVLAATARVGWLATPGTLLYAKGGRASMNMAIDTAYWTALAPNVGGNKSLPAWQAGVGVETYVTPDISLRIEGLYTAAMNSVVMQGTSPDVISLRPSDMSGTFGVALHF